jgi:translation initiation factor IF-3
VDFGKFRYELAKKEKESKKHQHASTVKEVQLSPRIDPHDLSVKTEHAIDFLCEDMKVKVTLRFRGREMQHTEFGFDVVKKFIASNSNRTGIPISPQTHRRGINMMMSPLPRNKRAKNPKVLEEEAEKAGAVGEPQKPTPRVKPVAVKPKEPAAEEKAEGVASSFRFRGLIQPAATGLFRPQFVLWELKVA